MYINKFQQRGMSWTAIATTLFILVLGLTIFFKLFPLYMDNMTVTSALEKVMEHPKLAQKPNRDIEQMFLGYVYDKNVRPFGETPIEKILTVSRNTDAGTVGMTVKYDREVKFQGNLYFLVKFETTVGTP